eukprot:1193457-Prorocentrum_minimum.AAC.2
MAVSLRLPMSADAPAGCLRRVFDYTRPENKSNIQAHAVTSGCPSATGNPRKGRAALVGGEAGVIIVTGRYERRARWNWWALVPMPPTLSFGFAEIAPGDAPGHVGQRLVHVVRLNGLEDEPTLQHRLVPLLRVKQLRLGPHHQHGGLVRQPASGQDHAKGVQWGAGGQHERPISD